MSKSTRRIVFLSCLVVLLTIPAELLLLRALAVPDQNVAIRNWAESLSPSSLRSASARIQAYPVLYRREIMRALEPADRAKVWRAHLDTYLQARPTLDATTVGLIETAGSLMTPSLFGNATDAERESIRAVAEQIQAQIGQREAEYLLKHLGPLDGTFAAYEPLAMSITNKLRGLFVGVAQSNDCTCEVGTQCYGWYASCADATGCNLYYGWPACGWTWTVPCNGLCQAGW